MNDKHCVNPRCRMHRLLLRKHEKNLLVFEAVKMNVWLMSEQECLFLMRPPNFNAKREKFIDVDETNE